MASPRPLGDGCASAMSLVVQDVEAVLRAVESFMGGMGAVESFGFANTCCVEHPDGLQCVCHAEVFTLPAGGHLLEMTRLRGDSVLFSLVFRLLRTYLQTGSAPTLFRGQLFPRCRLRPSADPASVPRLELPPAF